MRRKLLSEIPDRLLVEPADAGRPGGVADDAVKTSVEAGLERFEARRAGLEKITVGPARRQKRVHEAERERGVRPGKRRDPAPARDVERLGLHGIDGDDLESLLRSHRLEDLRRVVQRRGPGDVVRDDRIRTPENDALGMLEHLGRRRHVGVSASCDHLLYGGDGGRGVGVEGLHESALEHQQPSQESDRIVDLARVLPAVGPAPDGRGSVVRIRPLDRAGGKLERLLPFDLDEGLPAAALTGQGGIASLAAGPEIAFTDLRSEKAFGAITPRQIVGHAFRGPHVLDDRNERGTAVRHADAGDTPVGGDELVGTSHDHSPRSTQRPAQVRTRTDTRCISLQTNAILRRREARRPDTSPR